jgi:hypothetical protein
MANKALRSYLELEQPIVPFVHCSITDSAIPGVSDRAQLQAFLDSRMLPLADRLAAIASDRYVGCSHSVFLCAPWTS